MGAGAAAPNANPPATGWAGGGAGAPNDIAGTAGVGAGAPPNENAGAGAIVEGAPMPNDGTAGVGGAAAGMEPKLGACIADPKFDAVLGWAGVCEVPKAFEGAAGVDPNAEGAAGAGAPN